MGWKAIAIIQVRDDHLWDQRVNSGSGESWVEVEVRGANRLRDRLEIEE